MGFSLQRSDRILSRTPFGSPCPSFPRLDAGSWCWRQRRPHFGALAGLHTGCVRRSFVRGSTRCRALLAQGIGTRTRQGSSARCGLAGASLSGSSGRRSTGGPEGRCLAKPRTMGRCRPVRLRAAPRGTVKCSIRCTFRFRVILADFAGLLRRMRIPRRILRFRRAGDTKNDVHLEAPVRRRPSRNRLRYPKSSGSVHRSCAARSASPRKAKSGFSPGSAVPASRPAQDLCRRAAFRQPPGSICVRSGVAPPPHSMSDLRALPRGHRTCWNPRVSAQDRRASRGGFQAA